MPTYTVHLNTVASFTVRVEAEDRESAIEAALDEAPSSVCAQCAGWGQGWELDFGGEWDTADSPIHIDGLKADEAVVEGD